MATNLATNLATNTRNAPLGRGAFSVASGVELRGFEPLTSSVRTRRATGLRHSPNDNHDQANKHPPTLVAVDLR